MFTTKISPFDLESRVDAEYYSPEAIKCLKQVRSFSEYDSLGGIIIQGYRVVYHGTDSTNGMDEKNTLPFLSPSQIDKDGSIDFDRVDALPLYYKEQYPKGLALQDELLIEVKGNVSKLAIVPKSFPENLMVSGSLYKAKISSEYNSRFVLSFLKSTHGQVLKSRLTSNTIISYIAKEDLYSIPVFKVEQFAQRYIGNKVRQAEVLREWAGTIESCANQRLDQVLDFYDRAPKKFAKTKVSELENRLDPRPYRSHYTSMVHEIKNHEYSEVSDIAKLSSGDPVPSNLFGDEGIPLIRIRNIGIKDFIGLDAWLPVEHLKNKQEYNAKVGDIVVGMDGHFKAQFFIDYDLPARINQRVAIFRCHDIEPELLCFWLNRIEGQNQLNQWAVKTTVEHTSLDYISRIVIPRFDRTEESNIAETLNIRRRAIYLSKKCSEASKYIVEALIEGQITETQLTEAQQALEEGDNSKDRAILSKLTDKGYLADDGKPLFTDLDKLYELLDEAQTAVDANEESV